MRCSSVHLNCYQTKLCVCQSCCLVTSCLGEGPPCLPVERLGVGCAGFCCAQKHRNSQGNVGHTRDCPSIPCFCFSAAENPWWWLYTISDCGPVPLFRLEDIPWGRDVSCNHDLSDEVCNREQQGTVLGTALVPAGWCCWSLILLRGHRGNLLHEALGLFG